MGDAGEHKHSGQYAIIPSKAKSTNVDVYTVDPLACNRSFRARGRSHWSHVGSKLCLRTAIASVEEDRSVCDAQLSSAVSFLSMKIAAATDY